MEYNRPKKRKIRGAIIIVTVIILTRGLLGLNNGLFHTAQSQLCEVEKRAQMETNPESWGETESDIYAAADVLADAVLDYAKNGTDEEPSLGAIGSAVDTLALLL